MAWTQAEQRAAQAADDAFSRELERVYGERAGDMRYRRGKYTDARLQAAAERKLAADRIMRGEKQSRNPSSRLTGGYNPPDRSGDDARGWMGQEGDYFFEYGIGYSPKIYEVERSGKLKLLPLSVQHLVKEGHIGKAIEKRAHDLEQHAAVVFEIRNDDARQVGNLEGRGGLRSFQTKVTWSPSRSQNARRIRYVKRERPTLARLEPDSRIRWETKYRIGEIGAVYEFNVKLPRIPGATFSDEDLYIERDIALMVFKDLLKKDFKWVGDVYFTGRSGGWLAVEAAKGGATQKQILDIADRVDDARDEFVRYLREEYS